jgi:hypothetical protein
MKTFYILILLFFFTVVFSSGIYSQINIESLTGRKWKLDQLYANKLLVNTPRADSVKYEFGSNGIMSIHQVNTTDSVEMDYTVANDSLIISNAGSTLRYKIIFLNENFLVYVRNYIDFNTNSPLEAEFRFIATEQRNN